MNFFKNLYDYRELLKTSVQKDVRGKYKNSFLGVLWSFLNPLLQICVYWFVFGKIMGSSEPNYVVFLCCGLIPWTFFASTINRNAFIFIENGNIIKKVFFPREVLPISAVTSETINFMISTSIILAFVIAYNRFTINVLFYPLILIVQYLLLVAISFFVSCVTVYFRDLQHFIGVFLQLMFYATPIAYSVSRVPENFQWVAKINPMSYIIEGYRAIFYDGVMPNLVGLGILAIISLIFCILGYCFFKQMQKGFAEEL